MYSKLRARTPTNVQVWPTCALDQNYKYSPKFVHIFQRDTSPHTCFCPAFLILVVCLTKCRKFSILLNTNERRFKKKFAAPSIKMFETSKKYLNASKNIRSFSSKMRYTSTYQHRGHFYENRDTSTIHV